MRNAKANPYWNVPPELVRSLTAKRISEQGLSYLKNFHYEVLSDWAANAQIVDPKTINWKAIASGKRQPTILVRQLPGPWNSMGKMKFEMPNDFGIYLHDTPHEGKVRRAIAGSAMAACGWRTIAASPPGCSAGECRSRRRRAEQRIELPRPVPIYLTYLTVAPSNNGVVFRPDPYGWDTLAMPQMFGPNVMASASSATQQEAGRRG